MNLSEMAAYVTQKVNQTESEDVTACKSFIKNRYEDIWDDQLWKDSIAQVAVPVDPDNSDNAAGVVVLPELIDRPIAVRGANCAVLVNPLERYYRIDLDMFLRTGTAYEMALLSPAWLTVRPDTDLWEDVVGDLVQTPSLIYWTLTCSAVSQVYRWTNNQGQTMQAIDPVNGTLATAADGETVIFTTTPTTASIRFTLSVATNPPEFLGVLELLTITALPTTTSTGPGATLTIASSAPGADTNNIKIIWRDLAGKRYEQTGALPQTLTPEDDAGYFEIEAIFKPATVGTITVTLNDASGLTLVLGTMLPAVTRTPAYQRIRVFDIPGTAGTLQVAGKVKCDSLDFDQSEPILRGCEAAILAFAHGDMLERERRYGQAAEKFKEGVALLEQLKRIETVQQAYNKRLIPQEGYGSDWVLDGAAPLTF